MPTEYLDTGQSAQSSKTNTAVQYSSNEQAKDGSPTCKCGKGTCACSIQKFYERRRTCVCHHGSVHKRPMGWLLLNEHDEIVSFCTDAEMEVQ